MNKNALNKKLFCVKKKVQFDKLYLLNSIEFLSEGCLDTLNFF